MKIEVLPLKEMLRDPVLSRAVQRLRFSDGDFAHMEARSLKDVACFVARGPRGGFLGMLRACPLRGRPALEAGFTKTLIKEQKTLYVGVFVDHRHRRRGLGTELVKAARLYYPKNALWGYGWDRRSTSFWQKMTPITRR